MVRGSTAAARWEGVGFHGESVVTVATTLIPSATNVLDDVWVCTTIHDADPVRTIVLNTFWVRAAIFNSDLVRSALLNVDLVRARLQPVATMPGGGGGGVAQLVVIYPNSRNDVICHSFLGFKCKCTMFIVATVIVTLCSLFGLCICQFL
jgi:hypothetical protein